MTIKEELREALKTFKAKERGFKKEDRKVSRGAYYGNINRRRARAKKPAQTANGRFQKIGRVTGDVGEGDKEASEQKALSP
jgi:hypothetical protein